MAATIWHSVTRPFNTPLRAYQEFFQAEAPCKGDAFRFHVTVRELWTYRGELDEVRLKTRQDIQRAALDRHLRKVSRRYPPEAAAVFEHMMNAELASPAESAGTSDPACAYSVQVAPDEGLVQKLRDATLKQLQDNAEHDSKERHLSHLEVMQARWLEFLKRLDRDSLGHLAARLAGDPELAKAMTQYAAEQKRNTDELRDLFNVAAEAYRDKDVFDFVISTDSALSRLLHHIRADETPSPNGTKPAASG